MQEVNYDMVNVVTPVNVDELHQLLVASQYNSTETQFLLKGFSEGFDLCYTGPSKCCDKSRNIPFSVGNKVILWNKIMKEVEAKRVAGPFEQPPFEYYVQSPIGLVPKAGNQTRLIFHLSFDFDEVHKSINYYIPSELSSVRYNDIDTAVRFSLKVLEWLGNTTPLWYGKSDIKSAFRLLGLKPGVWWLLIMAAVNPETNQLRYFVDKCLPFGASISCSHFQRFSNGLAHIWQFWCTANSVTSYTPTVTNYLDNFLFVACSEKICNQ